MAIYYASASDANVLSRFSQITGPDLDTDSPVVVDDNGEDAIFTSLSFYRDWAVFALSEASAGNSQEVVLRLRSTTTTFRAAGAACCASGTLGADDLTGFVHALENGNQDVAIYELVSAARTEIGREVGVDDESVYHWRRLRVEPDGSGGSLVKAKAWDGTAGDEPGAWTEETTSANQYTGKPGFFVNNDGDHYVTDIGIADNGETAPTEAAAPGPTLTDLNTNNEYSPGDLSTLNGTNLSTSGGSIVINGVTQTITNRTATAITFTGVRGDNPYNTDLTLTYTDADSNEVTLTVQQAPEAGTFAVTAASPNTTDDASLWTGLVDTVTGDPITIVDGNQAWVKNPNDLTNLAITPAGSYSADETGTFVVQIWLASEEVWGQDQSVTYEVPSTPAEDNWPFGKQIKPKAPQTWEWGNRHPMTNMRVRIYK